MTQTHIRKQWCKKHVAEPKELAACNSCTSPSTCHGGLTWKAVIFPSLPCSSTVMVSSDTSQTCKHKTMPNVDDCLFCVLQVARMCVASSVCRRSVQGNRQSCSEWQALSLS